MLITIGLKVVWIGTFFDLTTYLDQFRCLLHDEVLMGKKLPKFSKVHSAINRGS
jgi:hypothetical protein